ncbi:MAG TPA: glucose-6-phosphate dehydrogenase assembly protein OpcA [Candidatus Limnocylindria bacterium]|nr:glucose-6-phosphate dehydrogenase assembly protein OpcA [Candidatus Limnocylindria bacterium]
MTRNGSTAAGPTAAEERAVHRLLMQFGEAESLATPMWEARDTTVHAVAAHLAALWDVPHPTGEDGSEPMVTEKGLPHARASVLNLIVVVTDEAAAERVVRTLLGLGVRHPSRALVLVPQPEATGPAIDARISTHCHDVVGGGERICYEEVVLTVRGEAARHLSGVVAPLLIHDLPTHVWWPGDPPFRSGLVDQLVELGDRILVDSSDFSDLLNGLRRLAALRRRTGIGDLSWERLAWWQELTAQFFDAPRFRRYLPNLSRLRIRYAVAPPVSARREEAEEIAPGVREPMAEALLYAGWIATRLGWRRYATVAPLDGGAFRLTLEGRHEMVDLDVRSVPTDDVRPGDLVSVRLRSLGETGAAEFIIDRDGEDAMVATNADGMTALLRRMSMETRREPELLSAQLAADVVDPVYEDALRAAAVLLASAREINA